MDNSRIYFNRAAEESYITSSIHNHPGIEIYYLTEGVCNYFIDGEAYTVNKGFTVIIPEGVIHRTNYASKSHARYLLNIPMELLPREVCREAFGAGYLFDTQKDSEPQRVFDKIAAEYESNDTLSESLIACYATELLAHLARHKSKAVGAPTASLISYAVRYIKEGYSTDISLSSIAQRLGISPEHLCRRFKCETGFGFNEYLTITRLRHAEHMLKNEPGRSIGEIAFSVGFNDSNYFSKRFKEIYGVPPGSLKKAAKQDL